MSEKYSNIDNDVLLNLKKLGNVKLNEPLRNYTSFKTGGPADLLIFPSGNKVLPEIIHTAKEILPVTVLGGCSNLLVGDKGIRGLVIMLCENIDKPAKPSIVKEGLIYSESLVLKKNFIQFCVDSGYEGMEFMAGIPGCIGGGIIMNAGTIDGTFSDILDEIDYIDRNGSPGTVRVTGSMGGYRNMELAEGSIIKGALFRLKRTDDRDAVIKKIDNIIKDRKSKHPQEPSAGSVFKNPPGYSSWKLVDNAGLKGRRVGGAQVSELHTNFIINIDNASSIDILNLVKLIQETVYAKFNVKLETEVRIIGEF